MPLPMKKAPQMAGLEPIMQWLAEKPQVRESSDKPSANAFCRVAPSVRFSALAILAACVFLRARVFKVRTCSVVQVRRVDAFLAIKQLRVLRKGPVYS